MDLLFREQLPGPDDRVLDPGSGTGAFIEGVLRWCTRHGVPFPRITGVESDPRHLAVLRQKFGQNRAVDIVDADFLMSERGTYDFIVGNPPYVAITGLSQSEKEMYRAGFATARRRFDLYMLFFEQALASLAPGGRLVFITPEKYLYVDSAGPLRRLLAHYRVDAISLLPEDTFGDLVTYPTITCVRNPAPGKTRVRRRDGSAVEISLPQGEGSWLSLLGRSTSQGGQVTLGEACVRISCGVATGADQVFVLPAKGLSAELWPFARPTIAGRQLIPGSTELPRLHVMLTPYDDNGCLIPYEELGELGRYLARDDIRQRLMARTCAQRKPWYAFHETPVFPDMLRPKILCKDIAEAPQFWVDWTGDVVPRHSVYYLVPPNEHALAVLLGYLESPSAREWLSENCQRAAKGYLRLQSRVLQRMPLPDLVSSELLAEPDPDHGEPDLTRLRLCIENKSAITAHRNRTNRYDDLSDLVAVLHKNRPDAILVATVLIGLSAEVLNVPDRVKLLVSPEAFESMWTASTRPCWTKSAEPTRRDGMCDGWVSTARRTVETMKQPGAA